MLNTKIVADKDFNVETKINDSPLSSLKGKCILPGNKLIIGNNVYTFKNGSEMEEELKKIAIGYDYYENSSASAIKELLNALDATVRGLEEEDLNQAKTVAESIYEGIDMEPYGEYDISKKEYPFGEEICGLVDSLYYAIYDAYNKKDEQDIFLRFAGDYACSNVLLGIVPLDQMISVARYFFDKNYQRFLKIHPYQCEND